MNFIQSRATLISKVRGSRQKTSEARLRFFAEGKKDPERKRLGETVCVCKRESMMPESVMVVVVFIIKKGVSF